MINRGIREQQSCIILLILSKYTTSEARFIGRIVEGSTASYTLDRGRGRVAYPLRMRMYVYVQYTLSMYRFQHALIGIHSAAQDVSDPVAFDMPSQQCAIPSVANIWE